MKNPGLTVTDRASALALIKQNAPDASYETMSPPERAELLTRVATAVVEQRLGGEAEIGMGAGNRLTISALVGALHTQLEGASPTEGRGWNPSASRPFTLDLRAGRRLSLLTLERL